MPCPCKIPCSCKIPPEAIWHGPPSRERILELQANAPIVDGWIWKKVDGEWVKYLRYDKW
jgi:hypothetical protein